jgi:hypothetical protein
VLNNGGKEMSNKRKGGETEFKLLFAFTMPIFFLGTIFKRALPWNWGRDQRSLLQAARAAAMTTIPFVFM